MPAGRPEGFEWVYIDTPLRFKEVTAPSTPETNLIALYAKDNGSGVSQLCYKTDAGTEVCLPTSGTIVTGAGVVNRLAYWTSASAIDDVPRTFTAGSVLFAHSDFLPQEDNTKFFWDDTNDKLMVGINSGSHGGTTSKLDIDADGGNCLLSVAAHNSSGLTFAALNFFRSNGSHSAPTVLGNNDRIARIEGYGYDGNSYELAGVIQIQTGTSSPSDGSMPGSILFAVTPSGSVTPSLALTILQDRQLNAETIVNVGTGYRIGDAAASGNILRGNGTNFVSSAQSGIDHGSIGGLTDDDHTQYALLVGRSGGQTLIGGTAASNSLTLRSTSNATKGLVAIADEGGHVTIGGGATASELRLLEPSGSGTNYTSFKSPALAANVNYTLPVDDGTANQVLQTDGSGVLSWVAQSGGGGAVPFAPGGRLTLTSATPVLSSAVTGSTSIYYALYLHDKIPLWDGSSWTYTTFTELTNTTTDSTVNPAAVANNSNYDLFVWSDGGTIRLGRGPAWTSDTARGTGAGTTELERVNGIWLNKVSITNGPAANRGTYVGTVRSNGSATIDFTFGGSVASGGTAVSHHVWNMYNRVSVFGSTHESDDNWNYSTAAWRAMNNSAGHRLTLIRGMNEDLEWAMCNIAGSATSAVNCSQGIGVDSTTVNSAPLPGGQGLVSTNVNYGQGTYTGRPGLGYHYLQALEHGDISSSATVTRYGDAGYGDTIYRSGMLVTRVY